MGYRLGILVSAVILAAVLPPGSAPGQDWQVTAGAARSDVGLDENRTGLVLGVGRSLSFHGDLLDFSFQGEYVQKAGNQPRIFSPSEGTPFVGDEEIRLHYLQPVASVGVRWPGRILVPRMYAGLAMALKVNEAWSRPVEDGQEILGYEDTDFTVHAGASLGLGPLALDIRYTVGLVSQLIVRKTEFPDALKADDPLAGVDEPEDGAKLSGWRVGAVWSF